MCLLINRYILDELIKKSNNKKIWNSPSVHESVITIFCCKYSFFHFFFHIHLHLRRTTKCITNQHIRFGCHEASQFAGYSFLEIQVRWWFRVGNLRLRDRFRYAMTNRKSSELDVHCPDHAFNYYCYECKSAQFATQK